MKQVNVFGIVIAGQTNSPGAGTGGSDIAYAITGTGQFEHSICTQRCSSNLATPACFLADWASIGATSMAANTMAIPCTRSIPPTEAWRQWQK